MKLSELKLNPDNPRNIKEEKLDILAQSIKDFPKMMVKRPIVYDEDKVIIGGNMRYRAIQKLGMTEIPDEWASDASDFTPEERHRFIMQDNAEMGENDWDLVANQYELEDLAAWGIEVPGALLGDESDIEEDEAPEVEGGGDVASVLGTVYQLGRHRVMCGDSTDFGQVSDLMDGKEANMVLTDPPYGMKLDTDYSKRNSAGKDYNGLGTKYGTRGKYSAVIGDDKDYNPSHIFEMFPDVKEMFLWGADYYSDLIPNRTDGSWYSWDKRVGIEEIKFTASEFELCWSKKKHLREIIRVRWFGAHGTQTQDEKKRSHPTQKPIEVNTFFINKFSKKKEDVIVDLFLGTGACLIACEQTDRTCYGMELDPKYVDVIRKRYAKFVNNNELPESWEELTPAVSGKEQANDGKPKSNTTTRT